MLSLQKGKTTTSRRPLIILAFVPVAIVMAAILQLDIFAIGKAALIIFPGCALIIYRSDRKNSFRQD